MEYYTVVADTYENAIKKAKTQYGEDIRIHSRRDYMTHGGIFVRRQPRCEIICYKSAKKPKKKTETKEENKDIKEFEKEAMTPDPSSLSLSERLDTDMYRTESIDDIAEKILKMNHISEPLSGKLVQDLPIDVDPSVAISERIVKNVLIDYEHQIHPHRFVVFIGPTGSGKTTTLAKAAHLYASQGRTVAIITLDTYRVGAYEQVKAFGDALLIPVLKANAEDELIGAIDEFQNYDIIFIDTMGASPRDKELSIRLSSFLSVIGEKKTSLIMTFPATMKEEDMMEQYANYSRYGKLSLAITKLDETETIGNVISFAYSVSCPIIFLTDGQRVPEDIEKASTRSILDHLKGLGLEMMNSESQLKTR